MPTKLTRTLNQVKMQLQYMKKNGRAIVAGSEEHEDLKARHTALAQAQRDTITARINVHTTAEVDRAINATSSTGTTVINATEIAIDRAAVRIIAAVDAAAQRRRRTPAVADGATVLAGSSTDPVAPLAGSVSSDLCQVIIKKSKFGREEHICNRPRLTHTPFGYTCRYHSQYRHDARRPPVASSTAASAAGAADADDAEWEEVCAQAEEDLDAQGVLKAAADAEEAAEDEDILNMTTAEQAINAKSVSRTAADSEEETCGDDLLAAVFGEPDRKRRKGKKSKRNGAPCEDIVTGYHDILNYTKPASRATSSSAPE